MKQNDPIFDKRSERAISKRQNNSTWRNLISACSFDTTEELPMCSFDTTEELPMLKPNSNGNDAYQQTKQSPPVSNGNDASQQTKQSPPSSSGDDAGQLTKQSLEIVLLHYAMEMCKLHSMVEGEDLELLLHAIFPYIGNDKLSFRQEQWLTSILIHFYVLVIDISICLLCRIDLSMLDDESPSSLNNRSSPVFLYSV